MSMRSEIAFVVLIAFAIGWREGLVTLIVIPTTILLTLFAANAMGYTINRVSLFALIFAIGILVDDAIVVEENIARHWGMNDGRSRLAAACQWARNFPRMWASNFPWSGGVRDASGDQPLT